MSYWSRNFRSVNIFTALPNYILLHNSVTYHINTGWARLRTCAVSVILPFWDAAAVWEAFTWDHRCDDKTPSVQTANSLKFYSRQAHYVALALFTWNLDRARGTKATVAVQWFFFFFFTGHQGQSVGQRGCHEIPILAWGWAQLSLVSITQSPALAQALSPPVRWHSMSPCPESPSRDWVVEAPAHDCHPNRITMTLSEPSCGWWAYWRAGPRCSFRLCPARSHGQRPNHQVFACKPQPQVNLISSYLILLHS